MSNPYRLVVFDWEGTLGDTLGQILNTVALVAKRKGFGEFDALQARHYVSLGLVTALKKLFPHLSLHEQEQLLEAVQLALISEPTELCLIPGAKSFVAHLKHLGIELAIASNKGQQSLQRALEATKLKPYFSVTRSAGQVPAKPCPQMLEEIMAICGATAKETLMIGDSLADVEMAQSLQVDVLGVDFYHQYHDSLLTAGALAVFDDYRLVANYLQLSDYDEGRES